MEPVGEIAISDGPPKQPNIVRRIILLVAILGGCAAMWWYMGYRSFGRFQQSTNDAFVQADTVTVAPRISGYVETVLVNANEEVRAGQPLVRVESRSYTSQAQQSEAQIAVAQATDQGVVAQINEQNAAVRRAEADVAAAMADAAYARGEVARYAPLISDGTETREHFAQLRRQDALARSKLTQVEASLEGARSRLKTLGAQGAQARAQIKQARAQLASVSTDLASTVIRASIAGRIGNRSVRTGQYVQAGTRLMSIVPMNQLYVEANYKETQVGLVRVGQPATVEIDAYPGVEIPGWVTSIAPGTGAQFSVLPPQNATGNFTKVVQRLPIRIALRRGNKASELLVPGMSVEVTIDTRSAIDDGRQDHLHARAAKALPAQ
ncbi:HlyD family secretion protein [Sphingomonas sp. Leaf67]|uniref:HlyD family secretion protein n=1 Tax=Sphingomonas sp. Leaf67 TaxID=1736230 RepID=UPI0019105D9B|nr:HlyD family secretion protein [Sphingomonas sp. Leaf67]